MTTKQEQRLAEFKHKHMLSGSCRYAESIVEDLDDLAEWRSCDTCWVIDELEKAQGELKRLRTAPDSLGEALNSGDGSYKP